MDIEDYDEMVLLFKGITHIRRSEVVNNKVCYSRNSYGDRHSLWYYKTESIH